VSRTSAKVKITQGFNAAAATITGTPAVGSVLTGEFSSLSPAPTSVSFQWYADSTPIPGATAATFTASSEQAGASLSVAVTAWRSGYAATAVRSAPVGPIS